MEIQSGAFKFRSIFIIDKKFSEALKAVNVKDLELRSAKEKADTYINLCNQKDKLYCAGQNIISNLDEKYRIFGLANEIKETGKLGYNTNSVL